MRTHVRKSYRKRVVGLAGPIRAFRPDNKSERNMSGCECKCDSAQPSIKGRCTNTRSRYLRASRRTPMATKVVFAMLFAAALVLLLTAIVAASRLPRNLDMVVYDVAAERTF